MINIKHIGQNWNGMDQISGFKLAFCSGDLNGDGRSDLMGPRNDGALFTYPNLVGSRGAAHPIGEISTSILLLA